MKSLNLTEFGDEWIELTSASTPVRSGRSGHSTLKINIHNIYIFFSTAKSHK